MDGHCSRHCLKASTTSSESSKSFVNSDYQGSEVVPKQYISKRSVDRAWVGMSERDERCYSPQYLNLNMPLTEPGH